MNYIGGRSVGKVTQTEMVFARFIEFVSSFLKIDVSKSEVSIKFNPYMQQMLDWYDIVDDDSLSNFLCYAVQDPKKYHLFFSVTKKVDSHTSLRSRKESVKDNHAIKFGNNNLDFFGDEEIHGLDSSKEDFDGDWLFDDDFSRYCEEVKDWDASIPFREETYSNPMKVKERMLKNKQVITLSCHSLLISNVHQVCEQY